jgi:methylglyoxal synthase
LCRREAADWGFLFMNIALVAHDSKKELMVQFCIAYCGILSRHSICSTGTTGKLVAEATGLDIQKFLSGRQGGDQQIAARIACNEIDLLLFFRDPLTPKPYEPNEQNMLKLCDVHNIPFATNVATGEVLVRALDRGDFDWRNIVNPKSR